MHEKPIEDTKIPKTTKTGSAIIYFLILDIDENSIPGLQSLHSTAQRHVWIVIVQLCANGN